MCSSAKISIPKGHFENVLASFLPVVTAVKYVDKQVRKKIS